ncbi:MAG: SPFH domain-containing protein [Bacteroidales bacterium]|jgi:membrane protease subunit (stomatin/prohibitin family)|nr:SPFH domain-containing protein [Bacteroidales bacterium]
MGLIKAIGSAIGGTLKDQWLDLIKCDNMDMDTLMVKQTTKTGQISKGSRIIVAPGQAVVIYDSGSVLDASAEEGIYTFDQSSSPSFFGGQFGPVFKEMWQRFTYGGTPAKEQAIFFFNIKEILDNKFGTATPIMFQDWKHPSFTEDGQKDGTFMNIRCYGKYTFQLDDMGIFMRNHAGTGNIIKKGAITEQMRSEVIAALQSIINELGSGAEPIGALELPSKTQRMKQIMDERVFDAPIRARGIRLVSFTIESVSLDDESKEFLRQYQTGGSGNLARGSMLGTMRAAAENEGGAGAGFMGIGMAGMGFGTAGNMMGGMVPPQQQQQPQAAPQPQGIPCPKCGTPITGKFCPECGTPAPAPKVAKKCPKCGTETTGKFCPECGTPIPADNGPKKCPKCGTEVTGKFCPECGTPVA